jgi:molecular chaperone HscB
MRVNEAYKTLQDPLKRAQYLLSLRGIDVEDESAKLEENELLMEVMEAREAVEDVENEGQLVEIRKENNEKIDESVGVLSDAFANGDMDRAAQEAVRLRYWVRKPWVAGLLAPRDRKVARFLFLPSLSCTSNIC